ncbi:MAG: hypothetical protein AABX33_00340 [Nanoarchaeota archaeon]
MVPKIEFAYSWVYERMLLPNRLSYKKVYYIESNEFVKNVEKDWGRIEKKILDSMCEFLDIKWKDKVIKCYVVRKSYFTAISEPLTIPIETINKNLKIKLDESKFIDILIHELIHKSFFQSRCFNYYFRKLRMRYNMLDNDAIIHIPIHAIQKSIYKKYFSESRLNWYILFCQKNKSYAKSWEIVKKEGCENIIAEIKNSKHENCLL